MSDENKDNNNTGKRHDKRDGTGQYSPEIEPKHSEQFQPTDSEYTKINSRLAKQLGLTDKLADYQTQYNPKELYKMLDFMADNSVVKGGTQSNILPPNQPFVPITPGADKITLPGKAIGTQRMGKEDKFGLHIAFDPVKLFTPKKKETNY